MVTGVVGIGAAVIMAGVVWYLLVQLRQYRNRENERGRLIEKYGVYPGISERNREQLNANSEKTATALKELMELVYYTCDNFSKYQEKVAETVGKLYRNGSLQMLCNNIVVLANLAQNGAFYKLSEELNLTELELRTCCFIYFGFKWQATCTADSITENAYSIRCSRIRKKMGLSKNERIPDYLLKYCNTYNSTISSSVQ